MKQRAIEVVNAAEQRAVIVEDADLSVTPTQAGDDVFDEFFGDLPAPPPIAEPKVAARDPAAPTYVGAGKTLSRPHVDPRPDLAADSVAWVRLLGAALRAGNPDDPDCLYGVLLGLRSLGATLEPMACGARLAPGAIDPGEYATYRVKYLAPHAATLGRLLEEVRW